MRCYQDAKVSNMTGVSMFYKGRCVGFLAGLVYGVGGEDFCLPKGATTGQAVAVVIKYIEMLSGCKGFLDDNMTGVSMFYKGRCVGFLAGLVYGVGGEDFCLPKGATTGQAVAVVLHQIQAS